MRASTAYFVGAGTMIAAIAIGLGGGLVAGNIMNPISPKKGPDAGKVERRAEPVAMTKEPSQAIQYLTGTLAFSAVPAAPAQAETGSAAAPPVPHAAPPAQTAAANDSKPATVTAEAPTKPAEQKASAEPASSPENAYAKANDSDVKQAASEHRRSERRQRWAERRRSYKAHDPRDLHGRTDWDDVERNVRQDSDSREMASRPRWGSSWDSPQIRLFGPDDD